MTFAEELTSVPGPTLEVYTDKMVIELRAANAYINLHAHASEGAKQSIYKSVEALPFDYASKKIEIESLILFSLKGKNSGKDAMTKREST